MIPYTRMMMTSGWTRPNNNLTDLTGLYRCVIRNPLKDILKVNLHFALCHLGNFNRCNGSFPTMVLASTFAIG